MKNVLTNIAMVLLFVAGTMAGPITTPEQAIDRVLDVTGLSRDLKSQRGSETAELVTYHDSTTPFISHELDGSSAWKVLVDGFKFGMDATEEQRELDVPKTIEAWIDSETGKIMKITIRQNESDSDLVRQPTAEESQRRLQRAGETIFSLAENVPSVSMMNAIRLCKAHPLTAKEIIIWYVEYQMTNCTSYSKRPVWFVFMRGGYPISPREDVPLYMRNHIHCVIDATDGSLMFGPVNGPYPKLE